MRPRRALATGLCAAVLALACGGASAQGAADEAALAAKCAAALARQLNGPLPYDRFLWDSGDPRKSIRSTMMPEAESNGRLVPVDYTLILVGQLHERRSGRLVEGSSICGVREGRIVSARYVVSSAVPGAGN